MCAAQAKTKKPGLHAIRFSRAETESARDKQLRERRELAEQVSLQDPTCQRLRAWLLHRCPELMDWYESDALLGCAMVALGMDPDEMASQPEQLRVFWYQKIQRDIAAELGHCLTGCDASHIVDGVCKHTGAPCDRLRLASVIEFIGMINKPKETHE